MVEDTKNPIRIDLNEFKLHIHLKNRIQLTLLFNSPSRRFYLSVIALVVHEMKRLGRITSIPLEGHHELLALLNDTIGGSSGSSEKNHLLPRIYRKWQHALPDLENAPLFRVLGKRKEYEEGADKAYPFTEAEKDYWANLFEYKGSEENVRLKFAIDRIGATLDDIVIVYGDSLDRDAWDGFISSLKGKRENLPEAEATQSLPESQRQKTPWQSRRRWAFPVTLIVVVAVAATLAWKLYLKRGPEEKASVEKMAFPLPDKPSIAVLPFVNMSGDPKHEFLSDGITEEIITALSKSRDLFVIARNSVFTYKGKSMKVKQVSEELGVRYVLEGSIRCEANRVRISAQFIDALTGYHLWAERYDRDMKQILALQEEIALKVLTGLQKLQKDDARIMSRRAKNLDAYLKAMEGRERFHRQTIEDNVVARKLLEEAIALDPDYARAYVLLAATYNMDVQYGTAKSPKESWGQAIKLTQKAIALDPSDGRARAYVSMLYAMVRQWDKGFPEVERALALEPDSPDVLLSAGNFFMFVGNYEEAIKLMEKAIRLNPFAHAVYLYNLSGAYRMAGRYEEARAVAAEVLKINPKFSLERYARILPLKDQLYIDRTIDALRKAGLQ